MAGGRRRATPDMWRNTRFGSRTRFRPWPFLPHFEEGGELHLKTDAFGYCLVAPEQPLGLRALPALEPGPQEVVVEVAGCGVCHTDIGFAYERVPTRHPLPLILGHEIAGRVVRAGDRKSVV